MSEPLKCETLRDVLSELISAGSALHMENEKGEWIDEVEEWPKHAKEHLRTATRALIKILNNQKKVKSC